ncbi:MAG: phosphopantothenoylcysteine decarboxylase [Candidatus Omnitrophica bacterium]|nr:phosphopantothenoylcysteine decarboxylase [Candidatus Omnitrophota bacterium]
MSSSTKRKNIVITAGPTYEPIDPVRIITNRSTGIMGYEIARAALKKNHKVVLISGPVSISPPSGARFIPVERARDMKNAVKKEYMKSDCLIMAAAVSDFKAKKIRKGKIKKGNKGLTVKLSKNYDILKSLNQKPNTTVVGFALETDALLKNARKKMADKKLDLIVANKLDSKNNAFGKGRKNFVLLRKDGRRSFYKNITKRKMAKAILEETEKIMA